MAKILLINPNKWGRGITSIWIASHSSILKKNGHQVRLFDSSFYEDWNVDETKYNTDNRQYKPTHYHKNINYNKNSVIEDLQKEIDEFDPDIIFGSAISSHIHGEGEYVNIQYFNELVGKIKKDSLIIAGGLQPTANSQIMFEKFLSIDCFISGESELPLLEISNALSYKCIDFSKIAGLTYKLDGKVKVNHRQEIISDMDIIGHYDYSIFDDQVFLRPYNGALIRAVDYELSRGCIYACDYCVETTIQKYYGFEKISNRGTIYRSKSYLRNKSAKHIFQELKILNQDFQIKLIRCQDTNFLTIDKSVLRELADHIKKSNLDIILYIETRPEGINSKTIELLQALKVDGVGMGVELSSQNFREEKLNRFADQNKIIKAFDLLKKANIKRTAYNIIGLPETDEEDIKNTIRFNRIIQPDNITVAFYSPYMGTAQEIKANSLNYFGDYEDNVDGQLRTLNKSTKIPSHILNFYKRYFSYFVNNSFRELHDFKQKYIK